MATPDLDTLYCQFVDSLNQRRLTDLDRYLDPGVVQHAPETTVGVEAVKHTLLGWLAALPDLHLVIDDLVTDGDHLIARLVLSGTHQGPMAGLGAAWQGDLRSLAPTGQRVRVAVFDAWWAREGRCAERWLQVDRLELLRQLHT
ncbi:MAG: ester cyclase [Chloroflexi bacterium]|nr:ester cyclase [Chloroflexota bacterium]